MEQGPDCESLKSDRSKGGLINFSDDPPAALPREEPCPEERTEGPCVPLELVFSLLEEQLVAFVKQQLQRFHKLLASEHPECLESEEERSSREAVLTMALVFLRRMKQEALAERLDKKKKNCVYPQPRPEPLRPPPSTAPAAQSQLQTHLQHRFSQVFEGVATTGNPAPLQKIYTELHMIAGGASNINQEHEVRHIETASRKPGPLETTITCEDIFKRRPHSKEPIRTVLTRGVAGVGKTVLTQKFSLDWAEGRANQDIQLLFPFTFRELNVLKDSSFSLVQLIHRFFSQTKDLCSFEGLQLLFIFDGLDECRPPLDFRRSKILTDPTESASVEELLVNLIRGSLLPSARLWITTRPAAANQIPAECVSMVTEVRGFTDEQKEQYFMKRVLDEQQATAVISHIKTSRSLFIMCHIPIFCWILAIVLLHLLESGDTDDMPYTLTQMYVHFLVVQAKVKNIKYHEGSVVDLHWTQETMEMVRALGKLAFEQLQKGNLIFYEWDLRESGLDPAATSVYSGVFTEVFREEQGLYQDKVYCFIHLSVQEFLAALYVHHTFFSSGVNLLSPPCSSDPEVFYRSAVDQALLSPNGHLDLFLRFLLGLSLPTNSRLLKGLLRKTARSQSTEDTVKYIYERLKDKELSAERGLNLLHCLNELNDRSLMKKIQKHMRAGGRASFTSPAEWSALSFLLLSSDSDLEDFDLRKYGASDAALLNLLPVIKASTKVTLSWCNLSRHICAPLASVLSSSSLTQMDLSHNHLQDSGVELLCEGLKSAPCRLHTLSLSCCSLSHRCCAPLASVLSSSSSLTQLDLSNNDLQDSGVELLCEGLKSAPCRLEILRLSGCMVSERGGACLAAALSSTPSCVRELDLSFNHPGHSAEVLTALQTPHGPLDSVRMDPAGERWMLPGPRKFSCEFSLDPNTAYRYLLLSEDLRSVTRVREEQPYPAHKDRFTDHCQVLSSTDLRGRCYWEVHWRGQVEIAVTYSRTRDRLNDEFGGRDVQSWSLRTDDDKYYVRHRLSGTQTRFPCRAGRTGIFSGNVSVFSPELATPSGVVGVLLDSEAKALIFYEVYNNKAFPLHTIRLPSAQPLFPGFGLGQGSKVQLVFY